MEPSIPYDGPLCGLLDVETSSLILDDPSENGLNAKKYNFTRSSPSNLMIAASEQEVHVVLKYINKSIV
jgi:hypothetical protein